MASSNAAAPATAFSDLPGDAQLAVLSFLAPEDAASAACTSRSLAALAGASSPSAPGLFLSICERRWGARTKPRAWIPSPSPSAAAACRLYRALDRCERLIGLWRRIARDGGPSLVFFEWGDSSIRASSVAPSPEAGSCGVSKEPFIRLSVSATGELAGTLRLPGEATTVPISVNFVGQNHIVVDVDAAVDVREEAEGAAAVIQSSSPPDRVTLEIYQHFANRGSPGSSGERASRRQRRRERGRRHHSWEAEHYVRVTEYEPTPSRPLQGLWKGVCETMKLKFYLITYDDIGGISCRRVDDVWTASEQSMVFWTSRAEFLGPPFSRSERDIHNQLVRILCGDSCSDRGCGGSGILSKILRIDSSYGQGRIWVDDDGGIVFGFLEDNLGIELKPVFAEGAILDVAGCSSSSEQ